MVGLCVGTALFLLGMDGRCGRFRVWMVLISRKTSFKPINCPRKHKKGHSGSPGCGVWRAYGTKIGLYMQSIPIWAGCFGTNMGPKFPNSRRSWPNQKSGRKKEIILWLMDNKSVIAHSQLTVRSDHSFLICSKKVHCWEHPYIHNKEITRSVLLQIHFYKYSGTDCIKWMLRRPQIRLPWVSFLMTICLKQYCF